MSALTLSWKAHNIYAYCLSCDILSKNQGGVDLILNQRGPRFMFQYSCQIKEVHGSCSSICARSKRSTVHVPVFVPDCEHYLVYLFITLFLFLISRIQSIGAGLLSVAEDLMKTLRQTVKTFNYKALKYLQIAYYAALIFVFFMPYRKQCRIKLC